MKNKCTLEGAFYHLHKGKTTQHKTDHQKLRLFFLLTVSTDLNENCSIIKFTLKKSRIIPTRLTQRNGEIDSFFDIFVMNFECDFLKTMIFLTLTSNICFSACIEARGLIKKKIARILLQMIPQNYLKNFSNISRLFIDYLNFIIYSFLAHYTLAHHRRGVNYTSIKQFDIFGKIIFK